MIKTKKKNPLLSKENFLNLKKNINKKTLQLPCEKLKAFCTKVRKKERMSPLTTLFQHYIYWKSQLKQQDKKKKQKV